ncbi:MAG: metallophosphoesterase [Deltaproteobacteria bacterium]|nr:metallophosphoesterase [Deltaproteobacteria bacterium]
MSTIAIGDVHGCLEELDELLGLLGPGHRLVFLGDLVDRGPDPVGVVRRVRELGAECVMGNHDEKHVRWAQHEAKRRANPAYKNPMRPLPDERRAQHAALGDDGVAFLASLPIKLALGDNWWAVHGGVAPRRAFAEQKSATLLRCRWVDEAGAMIPSPDPGPGGRHWATMWAGPENLIYGHHVHGVEPRIDRAAPGVMCVGIDTGCCFGGRLTAYVIETGEAIQVTARAKYAALRDANGDDA